MTKLIVPPRDRFVEEGGREGQLVRAFSPSCLEDNLARHTSFVCGMKGENGARVWESCGEAGPTQDTALPHCSLSTRPCSFTAAQPTSCLMKPELTEPTAQR